MADYFSADQVHRTVLLSAHDDTQPTLGAALAAHASIEVLICADEWACSDEEGQAALLTAIATGVRAFGRVYVHVGAPGAMICRGVYRGLVVAAAVEEAGALQVPEAELAKASGRPTLLIGPTTAAPAEGSGHCVLRASWSGWTATVTHVPSPALSTGPSCTLSAIASGALGISEIFGWIRARPGDDHGFRTATLNLWEFGSTADGAELAHAPLAWWLVGLGHLGQAHAWVISWLPYEQPGGVEIVLQDTGLTVPANHSTGVLTPSGSNGASKTRLSADALQHAGFRSRIIERDVRSDLRVFEDECHIALLGVDNLPARRLTSGVGWRFAVDVGLGNGAADFTSILIRRLPGRYLSQDVPSWRDQPSGPTEVPRSRAFTSLLSQGDKCGVVELAGTAVGAAFVGVIAACAAIAEACRELHGGVGYEVLNLDLAAMNTVTALADTPADVISTPLLEPR
ncbi:hypothetical protein [Amycolatopsis sp. CA-128772]|uniref:hypothetical protein n=1 Tax=Amycolatopsis sp. CA-128772 TaxID=2073159 RepID=UPI000CD1E36A|nr:hypothetical protein [Amycolatopsis sp. CA-128772]